MLRTVGSNTLALDSLRDGAATVSSAPARSQSTLRQAGASANRSRAAIIAAWASIRPWKSLTISSASRIARAERAREQVSPPLQDRHEVSRVGERPRARAQRFHRSARHRGVESTSTSR